MGFDKSDTIVSLHAVTKVLPYVGQVLVNIASVKAPSSNVAQSMVLSLNASPLGSLTSMRLWGMREGVQYDLCRLSLGDVIPDECAEAVPDMVRDLLKNDGGKGWVGIGGLGILLKVVCLGIGLGLAAEA